MLFRSDRSVGDRNSGVGGASRRQPYELHNRTAPVNAMTNPYQSRDGRWFMLAARQSAWPAVANAIGRSELLSDPRFSDVKAIGEHAAELAGLLDAEFRSQPWAHWKEVLDQARVPYGVIQTPAEAAEDPQLRASDIVVNDRRLRHLAADRRRHGPGVHGQQPDHSPRAGQGACPARTRARRAQRRSPLTAGIQRG